MNLSDFKINNLIDKLHINKKIVIVVVCLMLAVEIAWAIKTLNNSKTNIVQSVTVTTKKQPTTQPVRTSLLLQAPKSTLKIGEKMTIQINISARKATDGTDVIILYDPKMLSVIPNISQVPVTLGSVYSDYPVNSLDEKTGRIVVSGITSKQGGIIPQGVFGSVIFQAKSAGRTKISFDYTPGITVDSNVIETKTAKDILDTVQDLELNIIK